jgi:hypothetical protein
MCGVITTLPNTPSWHGDQFKKKSRETTFLYLYLLLFEVLFAEYYVLN